MNASKIFKEAKIKQIVLKLNILNISIESVTKRTTLHINLYFYKVPVRFLHETLNTAFFMN